MIYELTIALDDLPIDVTRTIRISSDSTFYDLHLTILSSFNWDDIHPHIFEVIQSNGELMQNEMILSYDDFLDEEGIDSLEEIELDESDELYEEDIELSDYFKEVGDTVHYKYDRPNFWKHIVSLDQIIHSEEELEFPVCVHAENDAPEENSQNDLDTLGETLRNDDSLLLVEEINSMIQLNFEDAYWDEETEQAVEGWVDDLLNHVFDEIEEEEDY